MKTIQRISVMACLIPELLGEDCVKDALGGYLLKPSSLGRMCQHCICQVTLKIILETIPL